jgi:peroxiredoxin Q/BCP
VSVFGCSPDPVDVLANFRSQYELPFGFLSDPEHRIADAYGAWGERVRDGQTFMGLIRSTFIIGPDGRVTHVFRPVTAAAGHSAEVLEALKAA